MHLTDDDCLNLILGLLEPAAEAELLQHASECPDCEHRLQETAAAQEVLRATRVLHRDSGGRLCMDSRHLQPTAEPWIIRLARSLWRPVIRYPLAGAAAALILLWILLPSEPLVPGGPARVALPDFDPASYLRGEGAAAGDSAFVRGVAAYRDRDMGRAIAELRRARLEGAAELQRRVFLGSALAWQEEYEEAVAVLEPLPFEYEIHEPFHAPAWWTLYLALRETGRRAAADSLLDIFTAEGGELADWAHAERRARASEH